MPTRNLLLAGALAPGATTAVQPADETEYNHYTQNLEQVLHRSFLLYSLTLQTIPREQTTA